MRLDKVREGLRVKTTKLNTTKGFQVKKSYLDARKTGIEGKVLGYVSGHGGDVWWIEHDDGTVGAYCFNEFNAV